MSETCDTYNDLEKELFDAVMGHVTADAKRQAFLPNTPFGPEDGKREDELKLADENAEKHFKEVFQRVSEHHQTVPH